MTLDRASRLIGTFGKREMELASIKIVDAGMLDRIFLVKELGELDPEEKDGILMLVKHGWLDVEYQNGVIRPSDPFRERVRSAVIRDEQRSRS